MPTNARTIRVAVLTLLTSLPAATALAQPVAAAASDMDSPALTAFLVAFCALVVGLLAHTARKMARLD
jgi:hypothetical protein